MKPINLRIWIICICAVLFTALVINDAMARSRGFKGFSSSRSFSGSKGFGKSSFSWGKSSKNRLSGVKRSRSSAGKMSSADRASYNRAKSNGTVFTNRSDALKSFKSQNQSKYPTKFSSQPKVRPGHIPPNISINGKKHKVFYQDGGYGYYTGAIWRPYSPFADPLMAAGLMAASGYYYGPRPGLSFMSLIGMVMTLFLCVVVLKSVFASRGTAGTDKFNIFK